MKLCFDNNSHNNTQALHNTLTHCNYAQDLNQLCSMTIIIEARVNTHLELKAYVREAELSSSIDNLFRADMTESKRKIIVFSY